MDKEDFIIGGIAIAIYCACGVLLAAAFGSAPWSVTWFACVLAWPVVGMAAFVLLTVTLQICGLLAMAIAGRMR